MSPYFRELLVYVGQDSCYESGSDLVEKLLRIETNAMQIQRLSNFYGAQIEPVLETAVESEAIAAEEVVYAQVDGGMLLTREESWKEAKLGRVFKSSMLCSVNENRKWIKESGYVAHLGNHKDFEQKMSVVTDKYEHLQERLLFITDGAKWINNWISAEYPQATRILDFYHAKEHLGEFATLYFKNRGKRSRWIEQVAEELLEKGVEQAIKSIKALPESKKSVEEKRQSLLNYYTNNAFRMNYPEYLARNWCIGSGAIEAAHRTVSQQRLKLSGQRWTENGAQNVLNLRVLRLSNRWNELEDLLKSAA